MAEAVIALLFGLGVSVAAIVYRMRAMERRREFDRDRKEPAGKR
jgi:predicted Kef-type K+ transport protein